MEIDPKSPQGVRLAEGMRQLMNGEGVERPEWTRFTQERLAEAVTQANDGRLTDRPEFTRFDVGATLDETITDVVGGIAVNQAIAD